MKTNHRTAASVLLDAVDVPTLLLDQYGQIHHANPAAQKLSPAILTLEGRAIWDVLNSAETPTLRHCFTSPSPDAYPFSISFELTDQPSVTGQAVFRTVHNTDETMEASEAVICTLNVTPAEIHHTALLTDRTFTGYDVLRSKAFQQVVLETLQQAACVQDEEDYFVAVNDLFCTLVGYERDELLNAPVDRVLVPDQKPVLVEHMMSRRRGQGERYELILQHKSGAPIDVIIAATPIFDKIGNFSGSFSVLTDITDRKSTERVLRQEYEDLDAFSHTVAHDLKNPLSVLVSYSDLLQDALDELPPNQIRDALATIGQTSYKMINIIDELLMLAQMRKSEIPIVPIDPMLTVQEAMGRLAYMIHQYAAEVNTDALVGAPAALGYPSWVEEVWVNYISNAIKYGGTPPIVHVGAQLEGDWVRYWVKDNGKGLPKERRERLFRAFERLEQARAQGYGLGLSIVKRIITKLNGEVGFESVTGEGSTFWFQLPRSPK